MAAASAPARRRAEKESRSTDDIAVDSNGAPLHPMAFDFAFPPSQGSALSGGVTSVPATGDAVSTLRRHSVAGIAGGEETSSRKRGKVRLGSVSLCITERRGLISRIYLS